MALVLPKVSLLLTGDAPVIVTTPVEALSSLATVLHFGIKKHGPFNPTQYSHDHFMTKARRHINQMWIAEGQNIHRIDESGQPHIIHAAADLLLAWECTQGK